jgi:hypothetical protein
MKKIFLILTGFTCFFVLIGIWLHFGAPTTLAEATFLSKVAARLGQPIELAELMPTDWEMVCESHGYDGPLYIKKYDKTYSPAAPSQDGVWGLIFIRADGSYTQAVGSCRYPGMQFDLNGCVTAKSIKLTMYNSPKYSCPVYKLD